VDLAVSLRVAHVAPTMRKAIENSRHYALIERFFVASDGATQRGQGLSNRSAGPQLARQCIWCDIVALFPMAIS
jgi:hypothetical protein